MLNAFLTTAILILQAPLALSYPANSHYGLIVPNALYVTIYDHKIAGAKNQDAWTLVTDGLKSVGQDEIVLTILNPKKASYETIPKEVIQFFKTVYDLAKSGKIVKGGSYSQFGEGFTFLSPQFRGLIYLNGSPPEGVLAPLGSIVAIPVTAEEMDAFFIGGPLRVTGSLSKQSSYFPFPFWCDTSRKSVFSAADVAQMKKEPILKTFQISLSDAFINQRSSEYQLAIPWKAQQKLSDTLKRLPEKTPAILLWLGIAPYADAALTWSPDRTEATAAPNSKAQNMAGSYVLILPGIEKSEFSNLRDGFVTMLTKEQWKQLQDAVNGKRDLTLYDSNKKEKLTLFIQKDQASLDMTTRSITKTPGWVEFSKGQKSPQTVTKKPKTKEPARTDLIVLMTSDEVIKQSITVEELTVYIKRLETATKAFFSSLGKGSENHEFVLQTHLEPHKKAKYKLFHRPAGIPDQVIRDLYSKLQKVDPADTMNPLDFELIMTVWR